MNLVVDIGNSRLKWARVRDGRLGAAEGFARGEDIGAAMDDAWGRIEAPSAVLISSVAGDRSRERIEAWMEGRWGFRPQWFHSEPRTLGLVNAYGNPSQLGSDRWAALIGARARYPGPVGVIDAGTAVTLDVVDGQDRHLGGLILPGLELAAGSLGRTANIREAPRETDGLLGRSTGECVANGVRFGVAGAVERWMREVDGLLAGVAWVATGGSWPRLGSIIHRPVEADPDLVLRGLARVQAQR